MFIFFFFYHMTHFDRVSLFTHNILVTMTLPDILMEVKDITINCDGHDIFKIVVSCYFDNAKCITETDLVRVYSLK